MFLKVANPGLPHPNLVSDQRAETETAVKSSHAVAVYAGWTDGWEWGPTACNDTQSFIHLTDF